MTGRFWLIPIAAAMLALSLGGASAQQSIETYKASVQAYLQCEILMINGRRLRPVDKELDFEGDTSADASAEDVQLRIEPLVKLEAFPGASRSTTISVENDSDVTVEVSAVALRPRSLGGVMLGSVTGDDFCCAPWIEVRPEQFSLRGGSQRNVRVTARFPELANPQANYYGEVRLVARMPDGQSAGGGQSLLWVQNTRAETKAAAAPVKTSIAQQDATHYVVTTQFANVGNVHFEPKCTADLVKPPGMKLTGVALEGPSGAILPLGTPEFAGLLDFAEAEPGDYSLVVSMEFGDTKISDELPVRVEDTPEGKAVSAIQKPTAEPEAAAAQEGGDDASKH